MRIANPLYDHAFKYLMSNDRLARKVLSVILDKEILELELAQQEVVVEDEERRFTLYRLDFKAIIQDELGKTETVLIELQKSKLPTNVLRFRNYLGLSYTQRKAKTSELKLVPLPIISIYILGYNITDIPLMATKVDRKIVDLSLKKEVQIESDFIELLTHACYILQVRRLPKERQTKIEQFMMLFNQAWVEEEQFVLNLEEVPEVFRDIAEYLQKPLQEDDLRKRLEAEQEMEYIFAVQEAEKEELRSQVESARMEVEQARIKEEQARIREKEARIKEEQARIREKEARIKEEQATIREKEEMKQKELALQNVIKLARLLLLSNKTLEEVAAATGFSTEELFELLKEKPLD